MSKPINNRYDFCYFFDCKDGNPNGDPDAGNTPRTDPQDGHGLVSDCCLKRKVRNFVLIAKNGSPPYDIFIRQGAELNRVIAKAHKKASMDPAYGQFDENERATRSQADKARLWLCRNFFDVRTFGAVLSTGMNAGQVRGPVQVGFSRSIDPVLPLDFTITRMAVTESKDDRSLNLTMGRKALIPYGLYRCNGFISANLARDTNFNENDLKLLWEALCNMWDHDRSAARGTMAAQKLIVFRHQSALGNAPAHKLFERLKVKRKLHVEVSRSIADYEFALNRENMPVGVDLIELL
jgi:CRISPR-associated protein Csd2